jgi:hypothetical protein
MRPPRLLRLCVSLLLIACASVGCTEHKKDCASLRAQSIGDVGWDNLQKTTCLSDSERKTLVQEKALYSRASLVDLLEARSVEDVLRQESLKNEDVLAEIGSALPTPQQSASTSSGPWIIPHAVLFLYRHESGNEGPASVPYGTAFILTVPQLNHPERFLRFLITARHLVDRPWAKCEPDNGQLLIRFNRKDGSGTTFEPLMLTSDLGQVLYVPKDPQSDLAAILLRPQLLLKYDDYDVLDVPFRLTATRDDMKNVRAGTTIVAAGLDPDLPGERANLPVFREGVISRERNDLIKAMAQCSTQPVEVHAELLSAPLHPGNSGAPVYIKNGRGGHQPVLVGIQSFVFEDKQLAGITPATDLASLIKDAADEMHVQVDLYQGVKKE